MTARMHPMFPSAFIFGAITVASTVSAQVQEASGTGDEVETVVVTGTLLKRIDSETALPITTLDAGELAQAGATNALDAMQFVGQNQSLTISNTSIGSGTGFASYANLRSLGSARTLVLVNGKRVVNNPYQALGVDLNTIPMALIDRIEVLADGASSTYGSDAIAGVVNFVTRREMTGMTVSATMAQPEASGGGETYQASLGGGIGTLAQDGWNLYGGVSWRKLENLPMLSRDFATTTYIPERGVNRLHATTFPANYSQLASGLVSINPSSPGCRPPSSLYGNGVFGPNSCGYDFAPDIDAIPPQEQWSAIGRGTLEVGGQLLSLEYMRAYSDLVSAIAPPVLQGLTMRSNNPFYPGQGITPGTAGLNPALPITLNWRMTATGNSTSEAESTADRALGTLEGSVLGWDYELAALTSRSTVKLSFLDGYVALQAVLDGLAGANGAPYLNPFGEQTAEGQQYLLDNRLIGEVQRADGELQVYSVQGSRSLLDLPAGPLSLALALEHKREESEFRNNFDLLRRGSGTGLELAQDVSGRRHSSSLAAEANVPLLQGLELGLAIRYDDYSDFGETVNPKVMLRYQPVPSLLLRGSYNTGFRAPTLYDLFAPAMLLTSRNRNNDPVLCPGGVPNTAAGAVPTRDCNIQFQLQAGGNPDLDAEESDAFSVGFMFQPWRGLSTGVDYWNYHVTKSIGNLGDAAVFGDPVKYADLIVRCSQIPAEERANVRSCVIPGGDPIAYIVNTTMNLGDTKASGLDLTFEWDGAPTGAGRFGFEYRATYVTNYEFQREPGGPFFDRDGVYFDGYPVIRYTHHAAFKWSRDAWSARIVNRHRSGYRDCNQQCNIAPQFFNDVDSYSLWDVAGSFTASNNLSITARISNLFDTDPPFTNKTSGLGTGWDERFVDPLGRTYSLLVSYEL